MGLPIVKNLIELHDGSIHVESEVGVGTTVSVAFPAKGTVGWAHGTSPQASAGRYGPDNVALSA